MAEDLCAKTLRQAGWKLLARNWRIRRGEVDLIALDVDVLVFVEVKASRPEPRHGPEAPALAVGPAKQRRLRFLASAWIARHGHGHAFEGVRFDVVGVLVGRDGSIISIEHIENAF